MKKQMYLITTITFILALIFSVTYYFTTLDLLLSLAITASTICYHLLMRLLVGSSISHAFSETINCSSAWFTPLKFESSLYKKIKVGKWKDHAPTFIKNHFNPTKHDLNHLIQSMCIAEIVHEIIMFLSFVPVLISLIVPFLRDDILVFLITSFLAAALDLIFVIIQRYNRPRVVSIRNRLKKAS
ncbi:MAG: hypothetical protein ACRDDX_15125 [Cellulosilyticaceae bacterium]